MSTSIHSIKINTIRLLLVIMLGLSALLFTANPVNACPSGWTASSPDPMSSIVFCTNDSSGEIRPQDELLSEIQAENELQEDREAIEDSTALNLFYYSMGRNSEGQAVEGGRDTCLSCDFITYFMIAMSNFSAVIFTLFAAFFYAIAPILLAIWIAIRVIQLNFNGGEGGGAFFRDVITKFTIFFFAWLFFTGAVNVSGPPPPGNQNATYFAGPAWTLAGPNLMEYSFLINSDVRSQTAQGLAAINANVRDSSPFECNRMAERIRQMVNNATLDPSINSVASTACVVERMHILGIATSVALLTSAWTQVELSIAGLMGAVMKVIWGAVLIVIFGLSCVWMIFVLLDVIVKALIIAAFLPIFGLCFLFQPSREVAMNAFKQMIAVPIVAFALGLTSLVGFYLITSTPDVYNNTYALMSPVYNRPLQPITETETYDQFAAFITRIQQDPSFSDTIPAHITSPWLVFLLLTGFGLFTLGKKMISIIEGIMEIQGTTELADNAKGLALKAGALGVGTTALMAKSTASVAGFGARGAAMIGGAGVAGIGKGLQAMTGGQMGGGARNLGNRVASGMAGNMLNKYTPFGRDGRWSMTGSKDKGSQ